MTINGYILNPETKLKFQRIQQLLDEKTSKFLLIIDKIIRPFLTNPVVIWAFTAYLIIKLANSIVIEALKLSDDNDIASMYVTATCNVILAVITLYYVILTNKAVKQTSTEQKINDLEKQLEEFYVPAIDILEDENTHIYTSIIYGRQENIGERTNPTFIKHKGLNDIKKYRYLADKKVSDKFDAFLKNESLLRSNSKVLQAERDNLTKCLKIEKEKLEKRLSKLKTQ